MVWAIYVAGIVATAFLIGVFSDDDALASFSFVWPLVWVVAVVFGAAKLGVWIRSKMRGEQPCH